MKRIKELTINIDKVVYKSNAAPEPIDEFDGHCPACGSDAFVETVTICQHGFLEDECLTVLSCGDCYESFHYQYKIDSPGVLTDGPMDFS